MQWLPGRDDDGSSGVVEMIPRAYSFGIRPRRARCQASSRTSSD
jgi:hypothetical protein